MLGGTYGQTKHQLRAQDPPLPQQIEQAQAASEALTGLVLAGDWSQAKAKVVVLASAEERIMGDVISQMDGLLNTVKQQPKRGEMAKTAGQMLALIMRMEHPGQAHPQEAQQPGSSQVTTQPSTG